MILRQLNQDDCPILIVKGNIAAYTSCDLVLTYKDLVAKVRITCVCWEKTPNVRESWNNNREKLQKLI